VPPPQRTAYFCARRRPGRVLRVSTIFARVPATASTYLRVTVAVPESSCRKFSAGRSALSSARVSASISHSIWPAWMRAPSAACQRMRVPGVERRKQASNQAAPQRTASSRVFWYVKDITQKKHTVLRNYPVIGRLRYFFEQLGEYFRQYFFTGDRDEMPFNRATRGWVYRWPRTKAASSASARPIRCTSRAR
jgi:hypothetical protein